MQYQIELKPQAIKDGKKIPTSQRQRIFDKIDALQENLTGDVKRLTNFTPEYRLRVGSYRVLFEIEGEHIIVYRILHRKHAYK
ncbi:MAG: type II toxin-antitoxin system RelE/ParE family toxin [bacterium]|nr:type II toxin-antitoxin system RelE/ParE family toxin [bacterium]